MARKPPERRGSTKAASNDKPAKTKGQKSNADKKSATPAASLDAIANEYRADRKERRREDKRKELWLTIGGLFTAAFVALLSLCELRATTKATKEATEAATKAVTQAERNAQLELRAYVNFEEMRIKLVKDRSGQDVFIFEPVFKNFGATPATVRTMIISTRPVTDGKVDALAWTDKLEGTGQENIVLAQGLDAPIRELHVPMPDARRLGEDYRLIYRFYVEYLTVFAELGLRKAAQVIEITASGDPVQALSGIPPSQIFHFVAHSKGSLAD